MYIDDDKCFECGAPATEDHHVTPQSLGGLKTIPLCGCCHDRVHEGGWKRRDNHSELVKAGQQRAKARGVKLGMHRPELAAKKDEILAKSNAALQVITLEFAESVVDEILELRNQMLSINSIADELNARGVKTQRGGAWYAKSVSNILDRLEIPFRNMKLGTVLVYDHKSSVSSQGSIQIEPSTDLPEQSSSPVH